MKTGIYTAIEGFWWINGIFTVVIDMYCFLCTAGALLNAINRDFGSVDNMKAKLSAATVAVQGSGWGWLGFNKTSQRLEITTCANQDPLQATTGLI